VPKVNNLDGQGPGTGASEIRYGGAGEYDGRQFDVVATSVGSYSGRPARNGCTNGEFGMLTVATGTSVVVRFELRDSLTDALVTPTAFPLSLLDLDGGPVGEQVSISAD